MRRILIGVGLFALITIIILAIKFQPPIEPDNSNTLPPQQPVTFEPSKGLREALKGARIQNHQIGLIANGHHKAFEIVDLTERIYLGNLTTPNYTYGSLWGIDFTSDGSAIVALTRKEVVFVDWETLNITKRIPVKENLDDLTVNPLKDEAYIFGNGDVDKNIYILDLKTLQISNISYGSPWHTLSPDFKTLYTASEGRLRYIDTTNHTLFREIVDDGVSFGRIIPSHDGSKLYVQYVENNGTSFGAIREYDVSSGSLMKSFVNVTTHLDNVGYITAMKMSPDGSKIILQEQSEKLIVLDLESGKTTFYPVERSDYKLFGARDVVFSHDGAEFYLLYGGLFPIDNFSPYVETPSLIDFRDALTYQSLGNFTLREGCDRLLLAPK